MTSRKIDITTEYIKLDQLLKFAGITGDGAQAKSLILAGRVLVGGEVSLQRGKKVRAGDVVSIPSLDTELCVCNADNLA